MNESEATVFHREGDVCSKMPQDLEEYKKCLEKEHKIDIELNRVHYESITGKIKNNFEKSDFWVKLIENLKEFDSEYHIDRGYPLIVSPMKPKLDIKSFKSFLEKTFRKNILENKNYPHEPENGWIFPDNWYSRIDDIIRTTIVVKYLDGVEFMIDKIHSLCNEFNLPPCHVDFEAKEEGYYAAHLYIKQVFEIPKLPWDTELVNVFIEIQITTQIQEVIRTLLHKYYEERRKRVKKEDIKWQWNYKSEEFSANYLGHILHYMEGMIMDIREKQKEVDKE